MELRLTKFKCHTDVIKQYSKHNYRELVFAAHTQFSVFLHYTFLFASEQGRLIQEYSNSTDPRKHTEVGHLHSAVTGKERTRTHAELTTEITGENKQ